MPIWSAVLNRIVAIPIIAAMMVIVTNRKIMGKYRAGASLMALGWVGTAVMAAAVVAMIWTSV